MFEDLKYVHFIGIGGIGMSALARYFHWLGKEVSGYDKTATPLTEQLQSEGMNVYFEENINCIPKEIFDSPKRKDLLVVYTPAVPSDHAEIDFFEGMGVTLHKRASVLGMISKKYDTISIAGTHGKTTTTSILAHIMLSAKTPFIGFIGGINLNFNSNLIANEGAQFMLTEADEFDRSFLQLKSAYGIITSIDPDHLDVYQDEANMKTAFDEFAATVSNDKLLANDKITDDLGTNNRYGLKSETSIRAENIQIEGSVQRFDFISPEHTEEQLEFTMPGLHNLENAVAAIAMARMIGVEMGHVRDALKTYLGVKRRFEVRIETPDLVFIDDYAHHPEEIKALVNSVRKMYPEKKVVGVFQPHLFSRTRDFGTEFARSLELLDELILLEIYPAREKPIHGINAQWLLDQVQLGNKSISAKATILEAIEKSAPDVLLTIGAGDIDQLVPVIEKHFQP